MEQRPAITAGRVAVRRSLIGNLLAVLNAATILLAPPGSAIRPMHVPFFLLVIAVFTALLAWPAAIRALISGRQVVQGIVGLLLGASPLFVGYFVFEAFVKFFGYELKP
jgi:hypothetical protein